MAAQDYVRRVVGEVAEALQPLAAALESAADLTALFGGLGWELDDTAAAGLTGTLKRVGTAVSAFVSDASAGAELETLVGDVGAVAAALIACAPAVTGTLPPPLDRPEFWQVLPDDLLELLLFDHLDRHHQLAFGLLAVVGVIHFDGKDADPVTGRAAYRRKSVGIDRLVSFITNPAQALRTDFGWGGVFHHEAAVWALGALLRGVHADSAIDPATGPLLDQHFDLVNPERGAVDQLVVSAPALSSGDGTAVAKAALVVLPVPPSADGTAAPEGLVLRPTFLGQVSDTFPLGEVASLTVSGTATDTPVEIYLRPSGVNAVVSVAGVQAQLAVLVALSPATPLVIVGDANGSRLELRKAHLKLDVTATQTGIVMEAEAVFDQLRLVVDASEGDGFLRQVLGDKPLQADVGPGVAWSSAAGLRFAGQDALTLDIPLDASLLGVIGLDRLSLRPHSGADGAVVVDIGLSGSLSLGPFSAAVQDIGISLLVRGTNAAHPGNLGSADLRFGFKPPTGIGLAIQSPAVSGGGFLLFDPGAGQYAGVFELTIVGTVSVKAIAIITTKMPDGSPGFALLILITAEGFTPIQLGLGFSLTGIGGLLALNHTVDADAVRGGLRSGVLDSVLFVKDPVKNAPRVISTLNHVFPLAVDRLLIGPLAEISWGTPPLVKIRLALLLEVPQPIRVILLAALSMMLPTPQDAVVEIHIDSIGVLDFGRRELALDASLHDSRILQFTLTGDMALRLNWGDEPTFVVSIGGFHPKFTPPKGLRPLNRLALTLSSGDNPRVRFEAYLALTSNTIQMGARVDVHAEEGPFALDGGGSFDALIQWSPFSLDVAFAAWAKITSGGSTLMAASIAVEVTGPRPWHLTGQASVQVLAFTATVGVDLTIGAAPSTPEAIETVDVGAEIWAQLSDPARWAATLPPTATPGVTLAGLPVASGTAPLVAHPLATVSVREQIAPLGTPIERVGGRLPVGGTRSYTASVSAPAGVAGGTVTESFAPGQYANLPDDARLAGPSFAPMTGGVSLTPQTAAAAGPVLSCDLAVQTLDVTSLDAPATPGAWVAAEAGTARGPVPASAPAMGQVTT